MPARARPVPRKLALRSNVLTAVCASEEMRHLCQGGSSCSAIVHGADRWPFLIPRRAAAQSLKAGSVTLTKRSVGLTLSPRAACGEVARTMRARASDASSCKSRPDPRPGPVKHDSRDTVKLVSQRALAIMCAQA